MYDLQSRREVATLNAQEQPAHDYIVTGFKTKVPLSYGQSLVLDKSSILMFHSELDIILLGQLLEGKFPKLMPYNITAIFYANNTMFHYFATNTAVIQHLLSVSED